MRALVDRSVLALEPNWRGLAFVMFEKEGQLVDWGVYQARVAKNTRCLNKAHDLIKRFQPDYVVMEDPNGAKARRGIRVCVLLARLDAAAVRYGSTAAKISRGQIYRQFSMFGVGSKDDIAVAVAAMLPQLAARLPKRRRIWESEHSAIGVFEAAALAITFYALEADPGRSKSDHNV
jgi:hypothetical protein